MANTGTDVYMIAHDGVAMSPQTKLYTANADLPQLSTSPAKDEQTNVWGVFSSQEETQLLNPDTGELDVLPAGSQRLFGFNEAGLITDTAGQLMLPSPLWGPMVGQLATSSGVVLENEGKVQLFYGYYPDANFYSTEYDFNTARFKAPQLNGSGYETQYPPVPVVYLDAVHLFCLRDSDIRQIDHWRRKPNGDYAEDVPIALGSAGAQGMPATVLYQGLLHVVYVTAGSDPELRLVRFDGKYWSPPLTLAAHTTTRRPAVAAFNGLLHILFTTARDDGRYQLGYRSFNGTTLTERIGVWRLDYPDVAVATRYFRGPEPGTGRDVPRELFFVLWRADPTTKG
ncbi:hypothetical protein [Mycobacteroides chelonae]|uniref:hypothetical protein n=1 Tax=Mycobacteroides chelonae TaxID=1774 RepID=UPI0008AA302D|nr:hypothetical protein [Mycobacteroides chelonae]OHU63621.1 hypothetical protein BKG85_08875 [Mycobacteroides chelonae]